MYEAVWETVCVGIGVSGEEQILSGGYKNQERIKIEKSTHSMIKLWHI